MDEIYEIPGKRDGPKRYITEEKVPALWRPPCACGTALPSDLYKKVTKDELDKIKTDR